MSCNCGKKKCGGCGDDASSAQLANQVSELKEILEEVLENTKFLSCGHPILLVENTDDVASFDLGTGLGAGCWDGWAICNGAQHPSPSNPKKMITTPNFVDRFIVQATGNYQVGDTGGLDSVVLALSELPTHNHPVVDAGHSHSVVDPGHDHGITDPGHGHSGSGGSHTHTFTTDGVGDHTHGTGFTIIGDDNAGTNFNALNDGVTGNQTGPAGAHSHTGTTDPAGSGVSISNNPTGVDVNPAFTGITTALSNTGVTVGNNGSDAPHENRPPFFAAMYVIKL